MKTEREEREIKRNYHTMKLERERNKKKTNENRKW